MQKPERLKSILLQAVSGLAKDPTKLSMFIDEGRIAAHRSRSLSFEYRYKLSIVVMDYAGEVDDLMIPILAWIADEQPDLLERGEQEPFSFESEILDTNAADVSIEIQLTERVTVERTAEGLRPTHHGEPRIDDTFGGVAGVSPWRGLLDDQTAGTDPVDS